MSKLLYADIPVMLSCWSWNKKWKIFLCSAAVTEWRNLIKNVEGREGTTIRLLVFVVRLDALGVVDHQLGDISEEKGDVVIVPGADLNVGTPPMFPHEIVIFLIRFLPQHLLLPHHIYFVSCNNQLETEVGPEQNNDHQSWDDWPNKTATERDMVGADVII